MTDTAGAKTPYDNITPEDIDRIIRLGRSGNPDMHFLAEMFYRLAAATMLHLELSERPDLWVIANQEHLLCYGDRVCIASTYEDATDMARALLLTAPVSIKKGATVRTFQQQTATPIAEFIARANATEGADLDIVAMAKKERAS